MNKTIHWLSYAVPLGIPLLIILLMVGLVHSPFFTLQPEALSLGITVDLVLTVPLVYFFLIRNRNIPKVTVISFFIAGIVVAGFILPELHQFYLNQLKTWVFPLVEIAVLIVVTGAGVVHLLIERWNTTVAWILTGVSGYTAVQLFGVLRSMSKRPIALEETTLKLRYGILSEATIPLTNIASVTHTTQPVKFDDETRPLSPLGDLEPHNVLVRTRGQSSLHLMYGFQKSFTTLALYVDEPERFTKTLHEALNSE